MFIDLVESQFYSRFFRHHRLIPDGLEDEVDGAAFDAFECVDLLPHILEDEVGGRTGGSREGHVDFYFAVVLHFDAIDEAELVDVDRNLRVVDGLQYVDDALFNPYFFCLIHFVLVIVSAKIQKK